MAGELFNLGTEWLRKAADAELGHVRRLGSHEDPTMVTEHLGANTALVSIIVGAEVGPPACQVITNVKTRYTSQSGILNRLRAMQELGLIEGLQGPKRSQVWPAPSSKLMKALASVFLERQRSAR
jgi:hypothetical protein